jgi:two-component system KDP operon response regulator KdpE
MHRFRNARLGAALAIVDEDEQFVSGLCATLSGEGYRCLSFVRYPDPEPNLEALGVKAVLLDLAAPTHDRAATIGRIRATSDVPILIVSSSTAESEKVSALDAGADDYLTKPLAVGEFLARVRVALRHGRARRGSSGGQVEVGELRIELLRREVTLRGQRLALTPTDYKLLSLLARNLGRVVPHGQLLHEAWGPNVRETHYLRVYMARLRRKLDPDRAGLQYIMTAPGVGYRLSESLAQSQ